MKSQEELNALKAEVEALNQQLAELNADELKEVAGGFNIIVDPGNVQPMVVCTNLIKEEAVKNSYCPQGVYCHSITCQFASKNI